MSGKPVKVTRVWKVPGTRYLKPDGKEPEIGETIEVYEELAAALCSRGYEIATKAPTRKRATKLAAETPEQAPEANEE